MASSDDIGELPLIDGRWGYIIYDENFNEPFAPNTVTILRADPWALILDEILHEVLDAASSRPRSAILWLRPPPETGWCNVGVGVCGYPSHPFCFTG